MNSSCDRVTLFVRERSLPPWAHPPSLPSRTLSHASYAKAIYNGRATANMLHLAKARAYPMTPRSIRFEMINGSMVSSRLFGRRCLSRISAFCTTSFLALGVLRQISSVKRRNTTLVMLAGPSPRNLLAHTGSRRLSTSVLESEAVASKSVCHYAPCPRLNHRSQA